MTERPLSIPTQSAASNQIASHSTGSVFANDALTTVTESVDEEEPYTIKCICDYNDDDGNTIYCEKCDTWQHIECFYPGRVEDASKAEFDHSCIDCNPRRLDLNRIDATERQRSQRYIKASNDINKQKRPPSKSHKKKLKPVELQVNGHHDRDGQGPQDHHPTTKKSKGHRSNSSVSKRSPPYNSRTHSNGLPPSPAHTPPDLHRGHEVHGYSDHFAALFDNETSLDTTMSNKFANLGVPDTLARWLQDPEKLQADVGIEDRHKIMTNVKGNIDVGTLIWPDLQVKTTPVRDSDRDLRYRSLITQQPIIKSDRVGELNGLVGFQRDFNDADKPPEGYSHSRPFVFYVPRLPLFIDTRTEGSICRYVRRSCRANTGLETFIDPRRGSQYHFWLVSERSISANEQITIPWDFRFPKKYESRFLHFMNLSDEDGEHFDKPLTEEEYEMLSGTINLVLSDYGGCACGLRSDCAFARFHQDYHSRLQAQPNGAKSKKGRKPRQSHISPTGTNHATNSRAASEGHPEQYDDDDRRSVSGSSRSKPNSRDLTPLHGVGGISASLQVSDREKRKLAMVEESFKKMEQVQPPRKKKKADPAAHTTPTTSKPRQKSTARPQAQPQTSTTNNSRKPQYVDTGTSRRQSISSYSIVSPNGAFSATGEDARSVPSGSRNASSGPRPSYVDSAMQTDPEENAWYSPPVHRKAPWKPSVPIGVRLLKNRRKLKLEQQLQQTTAAMGTSLAIFPTVAMDVDSVADIKHRPESPVDARGRPGSVGSSSASVDNSGSADVTMTDSPTIVTKPLPPPWHGQTNNNTSSNSTTGHWPTDLHVQMPPTPNFSVPNMSGTMSSSGTPLSASGSVLQSPFGTTHLQDGVAFNSPLNGAMPAISPVKAKKKMSLSDYKLKNARKADPAAKTSAGSSPTVAPAMLKPSLANIDEFSTPRLPASETPAEKKPDHMDTTGTM
ncbi:hypothetical protein BJ878DRAFT_134653 [Calycina marina]|uniref:SET domain-containing protein n=1 Tax=Calycina marina TaxID=1763456 RepID=A0A9P8CIB7_9HELO|nr:hypothetical protein BJ878DRAFT_134653 [Calycina marina]